MQKFIIQPPVLPALPIQGIPLLKFPIRRVYCVGRNYAEHAREMGHDADREPPFFFGKPADAVVSAKGKVKYPPLTENLQHEVELVVAIGKDGTNVPVDMALSHVWGYGVGVDLTRRDIQAEAKRLGRPWDMAKGFDSSAPCSDLLSVENIGHPDSGVIWLRVNDELKQTGNLNDQIWSVSEVISFLSQNISLKAGDLIFTGTPAGVTTLVPGDRITAGIENIGEIEFTIDLQ
jgi:fumarylpyruvate hydrolase